MRSLSTLFNLIGCRRVLSYNQIFSQSARNVGYKITKDASNYTPLIDVNMFGAATLGPKASTY